MRFLLTAYRLLLCYQKDPRIELKRFHREHSLYRSMNATSRTYRTALEMKIISKPELFCNRGFSVNFIKNDENELETLQRLRDDPKVTYGLACSGDYSLVTFRLGFSELKFADRIIPTFPSKEKVENIDFDGIGELETDPYPHGWDDTDWEVYYLMKDPTTSFSTAAKGSGLSWITIKRHFNNILKDCKIHMSFFPKGYRAYQYAFLTFKTRHEIGLVKTLRKLDRTSYLWKINDYIALTVFPDHYNNTVLRFKQLEEKGLIHGLKASIPTRYYTPYDTSWGD